MLEKIALTVPDLGKVETGPVPTGGLSAGQTILQNGITIAIVISTVLTLIFIILSGINFITASGDKGKIEKAKSFFIYALVGLIVILLSIFIVNVVGELVIGSPLFHEPSGRSGGSVNSSRK